MEVPGGPTKSRLVQNYKADTAYYTSDGINAELESYFVVVERAGLTSPATWGTPLYTKHRCTMSNVLSLM